MDDLLFIDDGEEAKPPALSPACNEAGWVVLVVDDDADVHAVTRMALHHFLFMGRPLQLVDCFSAREALAILPTLPDLALILLDVVMESEDAGTRLARTIRATPRYDHVQIIIRTAAGGYGGRGAFRDIPIHAFVWQSEVSKTRLESLVSSALAAYCTASAAPA
ncbi:hypothetical protein [Niveibacterium sp.]|uniref:hypothetical protein n=1 Tax=Niveibacterium sp. TaxID=2017444 RepID=UPI0035B4A8DE